MARPTISNAPRIALWPWLGALLLALAPPSASADISDHAVSLDLRDRTAVVRIAFTCTPESGRSTCSGTKALGPGPVSHFEVEGPDAARVRTRVVRDTIELPFVSWTGRSTVEQDGSGLRGKHLQRFVARWTRSERAQASFEVPEGRVAFSYREQLPLVYRWDGPAYGLPWVQSFGEMTEPTQVEVLAPSDWSPEGFACTPASEHLQCERALGADESLVLAQRDPVRLAWNLSFGVLTLGIAGVMVARAPGESRRKRLAIALCCATLVVVAVGMAGRSNVPVIIAFTATAAAGVGLVSWAARRSRTRRRRSARPLRRP